ncbi:MAG TPA: P-loop NTPase fold protein [Hanamia sp.]|nr:P-loop NTPase fold protein [Hanamia sp.]
MTQIDKSYEHFLSKKEELLTYSSSDISESDTRSKIIDVFFKDILGWEESDIERERFVQVGYYDYEISTSIFRFVVEAKKTFVEFKIPEKARKVKLKTIYKPNKKVIDQIRGYIFNRNLLYGIITNGKQFIIGKFLNTDGTDWLENEVLIYQSIDTIDSHFIEFYETISKEFVNHYGRFKLFSESNLGRTIVKSNNFKKKDDELVRNKISHELIPIITEVFEEIYNLENLKDEKILKECYVKNNDIKKYNSELGFIFSDNPPNFDSRINPVQNTDATHKQLTEQISQSESKLPDPIIIIGSTGAGKTTFIKYFLEVVLDKGIKKNRPLLYLDFRNETESTVKDTKRIYQKLLDQLYEQYATLNLNNFKVLSIIYKTEIEYQKKGFWEHIKEEEKLNIKISEFLEKKAEDPISHLAKISNYLVKQVHKRLCIVIDNADQLDEEIQKEVFILGHSFHRNLKVMTLISLREGYFYKFKNKPPFDAYHSTVFHITAPPYREVLDKRIKYVLQHFKFQAIKIVLDNYKAELGEGSLNALFSNLYTVLFERSNSEILSFLEETSYPNIRNGLEKFKFFLLSGHTKTNMYMSFEYGKDGKNNIPIWEFIKSVALESNYYYQTNRSVLFNIYYPSTNNKNHFTKIRLLDYIIDNNTGVSKKNNFILISSIINDFIKAGYNTEVILEELNLLHSNGLIFTNDYASDVEEQTTLDFSNEIGITPAGSYYLKNLLNTFLYYDLVLQDTPIYNDKYFDEITAAFPECDGDGNRNLSGRVKTTELFINYLLEQENLDHNRKEGTYGIKCLDRQIIKSFKENGLKTDLQRLENALTKLSQNIA